MREQVALAKLYGIGGFCFHHYWFGGKRLLERPVEQFLAATDIDFPFCLCWANENWTRRWDGREDDVLIAQQHSPEDDIAFIDSLLPMFSDKRYIRFNGRPVLIVYRASLLPDAKATAARWRQRCIEAGAGEPYLVAALSLGIGDPSSFGFDAAVEFPPQQASLWPVNQRVSLLNQGYSGSVFDYGELADQFKAKAEPDFRLIRGVTPSWDNEARKPGTGHSFRGSTPARYADWLRHAYVSTTARRGDDPAQPPFVFINAWNEWAEGAHLEPDRRYGYAYLHATANLIRELAPPHTETAAIVSATQAGFAKRADYAIVLHLHYDDLFDEVAPYLCNAPGADLFISLRRDISPERCREIVKAVPGARLSINANRGRDIQPFLPVLRMLRRQRYKIACKIHGKKSLHRTDGDHLRTNSLRDLLGSPGRVADVLRNFEANPQLGMLAPAGTLMNLAEQRLNLGNRPWLDHLLPKLGLDEHVGSYDFEFAAGSMFWFRVEGLAGIDGLELPPELFEDELGQVDGTLAHALERLLAVASQKRGLRLEAVDPD